MELWSFDSAHTGMTSSISIASRSSGSDAMLFVTIGAVDSDSDQSDTDSRKWQRVRRHEHNPISADVGNSAPEGVEGEAEEDDSILQGTCDALKLLVCHYCEKLKTHNVHILGYIVTALLLFHRTWYSGL